jgi:flagellar operon protein (TIGR03826 family)
MMNGELRNCPECGRLFAYQGKNVCKKCTENEEDEYMIVRKYVRDHSGATVFEVAEETGVEEEKILRFLRDGRLESRGFNASLECERCGKKITSGRLCDACRSRLSSEFNQAIPQKKENSYTQSVRQGEKMFIKKETNTRPTK